MGRFVNEPIDAARRIFRSNKNCWLFIFLSFAFFLLFIYLPVLTTPGDDFWFQLSILKRFTLLVLILLSLLNGYLIVMHVEIHRLKALARSKRTEFAKDSATSISILTSSIVATIGCASCYSSVISIFGLGGVTFVGTYRNHIALAAILISLAAIYLTSKRLNGHCEVCKIG